MEIKENVFRAYDIRGIYPSEIDERFAYLLGRAFFDWSKTQKIVVARDCRIGSEKLALSLSRGFKSLSGDVIYLGITTTPLFYWAINQLKIKTGIMVTASHNPKEYNGFKIVVNNEQIGTENGLLKIKEMMEEQKLRITNDELRIKSEIRISKNFKELDLKKDYIKFLIQKSDIKKALEKNLMPMNIALDGSNGTAGLVLEPLLNKLKIKHTSLHFDCDGNFPNHSPDPRKEEALREATKNVLENKASIGAVFDGDADRVMFIDEKGRVCNVTNIAALLAKETLVQKKGAIVYDVRFSRIMAETIKEMGGVPIITKVGGPSIKEAMKKERALLGCERSSHYVFKENFYQDSAILAFLKIVKIILEKKKPFSDLVSAFDKYCQPPEIDIEIKETKDQETLIKKVAEHFSDGKQSWLDGLTVEYKEWWFNLRPSNTEPLLRVNIEATTPQLLKEKKKELIQLLTTH